MATPHDVAELMQRAHSARFERPAEARRDLVDAVALCREAGEPRALIRALKGLGQIERDQGHVDAALLLYEEAVQLCRSSGDPLLLAHTVRHLGDLHQDAGRPHLAEPCYHEALSLYRGDVNTRPLDLANAIRSLAVLKEDAGATEEASRLWQEAHHLYVVAGVPEGVADSAARLALLAWRASDDPGCREWLTRAQAAAASSADPETLQFVRSIQAQMDR